MSQTPDRARRRRVPAILGAAALAATAAAGPALAAPGSSPVEHLGDAESLGIVHPLSALDGLDGVEGAVTDAWFVQLKGAPSASGGNAAANAGVRQQFLRDARSAGSELRVEREFGTLWHGLSVRGSQSDVARAVSASTQAVAVFPVAEIAAPEVVPGTQPEMDFALGMTGADIAQSELALSGAGVKVGIIDSGMDIDHPDFGGGGVDGETVFPTERIAHGWDFVGDAYNADASSPAYNPVPAPDANPDDCGGHGTHVGGIVGADGAVTGVAPEVTFGAYRVFGCAGSTTSDIIVEALEMAYEDGMDVVNMSLGAAFQNWPQYPTAAASDTLVDRGVVVVASIGNSGANGVYSAGAPGVGEKVIGVASYDNTHVQARKFLVSPDDTEVSYATASGAPNPPDDGTMPVVALGPEGSDAARACAPIETDLTGQLVLLERGVCPFHLKGVHAQQAGAAGVVLYNNVPGMLNATVAGDPPVTIPYVTILQSDGRLILDRLADGPVEITWTDEPMVAPNPTGGLISSFSSYGLAADLTVKPDLGAPGGSIYATYPLELGGHATLSGTSMSSPHVAGAVALLLEARPDIPAHEVRPLLQNHAVPAVWSGNPGLGFLDSVHRQGAGMIHIDRTILATSAVTPGKLSLGESVEGGHTRTLTVTNGGPSDLTYAVSSTPGISTTGINPNAPGYAIGGVTVSAPDTVTVPAGGSAELVVTVDDTAAAATPGTVYGGYLELTAEGADTLRVPFAGFAGDYQSLPVITAAGSPFPLLAEVASCSRFVGVSCTMGGSYAAVADGHVYTMVDGDVPNVLLHLRHAPERVEMRLYHANADGTKGRAVHPRFNVAMEGDYLGRSSGPSTFSAWAWDGTRAHSAGNPDNRKVVPNGDYVLEVNVLKALGDAGNPEHWETWTGPSFTVEAPDTRPGKGRG